MGELYYSRGNYAAGVIFAARSGTRVYHGRESDRQAGHPFPSTAPIETAGGFLIVLGMLLGLWAMVMFLRARTAIIPFKAASALVESGPYRVSRNPMYTGMAIVYLGLMLLLNWGWMLPIFPVVLVSLYHLVIKKEERHLLAVFGEEYESYCRRVRRWI